MARNRKTSADRRRERTLAPKLIGVGVLLGVVPLLFSHTLLAAGLRPLAPIGLLLLATGCALLWWQFKQQRQGTSVVVSFEKPTASKRSPLAAVPRPSADRTRPTSDHVDNTEPHKGGATRIDPTAWGPAVFDVIEWRRFEALIETLFAQAGFETKSQSHGADEGIDIWLYSRSQPGPPVSLVQCKHWQGKRVGVDKVRELRGVMAAKNVTRGQFATTSSFTADAAAFAKENGINLLDVQALLALIGKRSAEQQAALLAVALEGEYWRATCVNCGTKMVERSPRSGGSAFWGCPKFPKCKTTMPMRAALAQ